MRRVTVSRVNQNAESCDLNERIISRMCATPSQASLIPTTLECHSIRRKSIYDIPSNSVIAGWL